MKPSTCSGLSEIWLVGTQSSSASYSHQRRWWLWTSSHKDGISCQMMIRECHPGLFWFPLKSSKPSKELTGPNTSGLGLVWVSVTAALLPLPIVYCLWLHLLQVIVDYCFQHKLIIIFTSMAIYGFPHLSIRETRFHPIRNNLSIITIHSDSHGSISSHTIHTTWVKPFSKLQTLKSPFKYREHPAFHAVVSW